MSDSRPPQIDFTCHDVLERLPDYVDGALSQEEVNGVNRHLVSCEHCEHFGGLYGELIRVLRQQLAAPVGDVRARLDARMAAHWKTEDDG